jgi:integrase
MGGNSPTVKVYGWDSTRPMGSWRKAWLDAGKKAGIRYRWHDLRHTFVSRLAENANVSGQTIRSLAGHVSRQMLERYSHIRSRQNRPRFVALKSRRARQF